MHSGPRTAQVYCSVTQEGELVLSRVLSNHTAFIAEALAKPFHVGCHLADG